MTSNFIQAMPSLMGIINVTPDSFSDGGIAMGDTQAANRAKVLLSEGADILDIGGESTRPGATEVSHDEELVRVLPAIHSIKEKYPEAVLSIDTYKAKVAEKALQAGASIVNDVWGLRREPDIVKVAAEHNATVIISHWEKTTYDKEDVLDGVKNFLANSAAHAMSKGIHPDKIILDPGIGFGKTPEANLVLLHHLEALKELGFRLLVGTSRKSFIGKITQEDNPEKRLAGTLASNLIAAFAGADIVRVHDVKAHKDAFLVALAIARQTIQEELQSAAIA
jgi:dihydropteroate synthase